MIVFLIFEFLVTMVLTGLVIWVTVLHNKVNELVDEVNKIKQVQEE